VTRWISVSTSITRSTAIVDMPRSRRGVGSAVVVPNVLVMVLANVWIIVWQF
jgi:hypothetical protein